MKVICKFFVIGAWGPPEVAMRMRAIYAPETKENGRGRELTNLPKKLTDALNSLKDSAMFPSVFNVVRMRMPSWGPYATRNLICI